MGKRFLNLSIRINNHGRNRSFFRNHIGIDYHIYAFGIVGQATEPRQAINYYNCHHGLLHPSTITIPMNSIKY